MSSGSICDLIEKVIRLRLLCPRCHRRRWFEVRVCYDTSYRMCQHCKWVWTENGIARSSAASASAS